MNSVLESTFFGGAGFAYGNMSLDILVNKPVNKINLGEELSRMSGMRLWQKGFVCRTVLNILSLCHLGATAPHTPLQQSALGKLEHHGGVF